MARSGSQSYFSSGLGFGGDEGFWDMAGSASARPSAVKKTDSTSIKSAAQSKDAGAPKSTLNANKEFGRGSLNSRFAVRGSVGARGSGSGGSGVSQKVNDDSKGAETNSTLANGVAKEHGSKDQVQREDSGRGSLTGKPGKSFPGMGKEGGSKAPGVRKADLPGDDLQSKRAAAAAAAFNVPWRGNPGMVKAGLSSGSVTASFQVTKTAKSPGSNAPGMSQSRGRSIGEKVGAAKRPSGLSGDQEVPATSKGSSKSSLVGGFPSFQETSSSVRNLSGVSFAKQGEAAPYSNSNSAQSEGLDSIRANYEERAGLKGQGKRAEAGGISSFLNLNSPPPGDATFFSPPAGDATFFDAFADAASGPEWMKPPTQEEIGRTRDGGQNQGFSLFSDQAFGFPAPKSSAGNALGSGQRPEGSPGGAHKHRQFATMFRQKQAEGLAQGLDQLNLSRQSGPPDAPPSIPRGPAKPAFVSQPSTEGASLFQVPPEVLFGGGAPAGFSLGIPTEKGGTAKTQEGPDKATKPGPSLVFGAQPAKPTAVANPFLYKTPPHAPFGQKPTASIGTNLPSPSFTQSPSEKPQAPLPQGIFPYVFSAGSSGGSAQSDRSAGKTPGEVDGSQLSQSFAERLHLAGSNAEADIKPPEGAESFGGAKSQAAADPKGFGGTTSSLEGLRSFRFKGSVPDEETSETLNKSQDGPVGKSQPAPTTREANSGVSGSPQAPPFVAFGSRGASPGTSAKRRSEQKMTKKASPSSRNAFTATRSLQRTPVGKPPLPASPKPSFAAVGVVESGASKSDAGRPPLGETGEAQNGRPESPQPMDISPGRDWEEEDRSGALNRGVSGNVEASEEKGFGAAFNKRYEPAGVGQPSGGRGAGVNGPGRGGVNGPQVSANGPRVSGANGPQVSASYDGDLEEGSSSFEESESDKRAAENGSAWTGRWTPPKEPYDYDSSESDSQSEKDVNPEALDKDWVRGEEEKLERLKKTEREAAKDEEEGLQNGFDSVAAEELDAGEVEALGGHVEDMDLGSVASRELAESLQSDAEDEAESRAEVSSGARTDEPVSERASEQVSDPGGLKEDTKVKAGFTESAKPKEGKFVEPEVAPKVSLGPAAASFVFGVEKSLAPGGAFAFQAQSPSSPPKPTPVAGSFVFTSGPTSPKSPSRSSLSRRSTDKLDSLRRSSDSNRRRSLDKGKSLRRSGNKMAPGSADQGIPPGAFEGAGKPPEPPGWGKTEAAKSGPFSEWTFPGTESPASTNPLFPASPNPMFSGSFNPAFSSFPGPGFPGSPSAMFEGSPNPTFAGSPNPSAKSGLASPGPVHSPKQVRKARRVGTNRARPSWEKVPGTSSLGGAVPFTGPAESDLANPESMDEENANGKRQELQAAGGRKPSRKQVYYPEDSGSFFQYLDPGTGAPVEGLGAEAQGAFGDAPPQVSFDAAQASEAASTCERWRLKGNQAYAGKDYKGAEALYTKGVEAVTTPDGLVYDGCTKGAGLCLSNRAAVRMTLGRVREALSDCQVACAVDPDFEKVRLRAANCHLILGEFDAASALYEECSKTGKQGGGAVSIKFWAEAAASLKRAEEMRTLTAKAADLLDCPELLSPPPNVDPAAPSKDSPHPEATSVFTRPLRQVSASNASEALKLVSGALVVAPHSEALVQMKALALLWLRKFDEVLRFCESTLAASELNSAPDEGEENGSDGFQTGVESVRVWRWRVCSLAQYHLGKLEEADELAGKVAAVTVGKSGAAAASEETPEGLKVFIKELLKHKAAGNTAFQSGKREAAIEHYSAALACNSSSRPFNAVCLANRAAAYQALGSFAEAIADCSRAIVLDPSYAKALSRRATLHELIRDHTESVRDLERLSELLSARQTASGRDPQLVQEMRGVTERKKKAQEASQKEIPVDHYKVLGVEKDGGEAEIKKAYRRAALRHHPDKAVQFLSMLKEEEKAAVTEEIHSEAERLFKIIGEAYNVLSNPSKRMAYDADEEDRTLRTSRRNFGRSTHSHGFARAHGGRGTGASSWSNVRRPFDSEWAEDFFGRKGRGGNKSRDDNSDYYWDADFY